MEQSETTSLLKAKITKILFLLLLVRLGLYIPVPNIDLDLFSQNQNTNPIFGFAKTLEQNYELLNHLELFKMIEKPILVGVSRKSMIYKTLETTANDALNGTTVLNTIALQKGASILRVHDVKEAMETIKLVESLNA